MKEVSTVVAAGKFIVIDCLVPGGESLAWSLITKMAGSLDLLSIFISL